MSFKCVSDLSRALIELAWHFGPKGLDGACCDNLSMPEFIALDKVARTENCPVREVGYPLGFSKSGATRIVNRLEKKGYVEKIKAHEDARIFLVEITEKGKAVLASADRNYNEQFQTLLSKMPGYTRKDVSKFLNDMAKAMRD